MRGYEELTPIIAIPGFSEPVACWTHLLAAGIFAIAAFFLLRRGRGHTGRMIALSVYVFGVLFVLSMSGTFHLLEPGRTPHEVLLRLDHAAIWWQIAGTYTPIHAIMFRGPWRWLFLTLVWVFAIAGLTLKTIFFHDVPEWASLGGYLGLGWLGGVSMVQMTRRFGFEFTKPILAGGLWFTVGAVLEFVRWPELIPGVIGPHELFHLAVIAGIAVHWRYIFYDVLGTVVDPPQDAGDPGG